MTYYLRMEPRENLSRLKDDVRMMVYARHEFGLFQDPIFAGNVAVVRFVPFSAQSKVDSPYINDNEAIEFARDYAYAKGYKAELFDLEAALEKE